MRRARWIPERKNSLAKPSIFHVVTRVVAKAGVEVRATHKFTAEGMILNRDLDAFAMTRDKGRICVLKLGFNSDKDTAQINEKTVNLPTEGMDNPQAVAGRSDLIYMASRHRDGKLHLFVVNRNDPGKAVADVSVAALDKEEDFIPDGIAITDEMVFLGITRGRILAFNSK